MASPNSSTTLTKSDKKNLMQNISNIIAIGKESALAGLELVAGFNPAIASAIKTISSPKVTQLLTTIKDEGVDQAADYATNIIGNIQEKKNQMQGTLTNKLEGVVGTAADAANSSILSSTPDLVKNSVKNTMTNQANTTFTKASMAAQDIAGNAAVSLKNKAVAQSAAGGSRRQRIRRRRTKKRSGRRLQTKKLRTQKHRQRNAHRYNK